MAMAVSKKGFADAAGLHSANVKAIGWRDLDEDDCDDAMVMVWAEHCPPFI